jgi:hypothetical protein
MILANWYIYIVNVNLLFLFVYLFYWLALRKHYNYAMITISHSNRYITIFMLAILTEPAGHTTTVLIA